MSDNANIELTKSEISPTEIKLTDSFKPNYTIDAVDWYLKTYKYKSLIEKLNEPSFFDIVWWLIKQSPKIIGLIYNIVKFIKILQGK
jgi:hypothetical protein